MHSSIIPKRRSLKIQTQGILSHYPNPVPYFIKHVLFLHPIPLSPPGHPIYDPLQCRQLFSRDPSSNFHTFTPNLHPSLLQNFPRLIFNVYSSFSSLFTFLCSRVTT